MAKSIADIRAMVDDGQGAITVPLEELREASGFGRMGVHVKTKIQTDIAKAGLKLWPTELPDRQTALIRVYDPKTELGQIIDSVLTVNIRTDVYLHRWAELSPFAA